MAILLGKMGGDTHTKAIISAFLLCVYFAGTHGLHVDTLPLLRQQRALLQSGVSGPGYFPSPTPANPSGTSPNPAPVPAPEPAANSSAQGKSSGGISSTTRTGIIIGVIVCLGLAVIIAAVLYVYCRRHNQLNAPGYKPSALEGGGNTAHHGSFDILLTDTNAPNDSGGRGAAYAVAPVAKPPSSAPPRGGPAMVLPPASWRDDASSDVSRTSAAPSSRSLAPSGRTRSQPDVLDASPAVIRGYPVRSLVSHASSASMGSAISADPSLGAATSFASTNTSAATATPHRRTASTGSESLPSSSIAVPRLPQVPVSAAGGGTGTGGIGLIPGARPPLQGTGAARGNTASGVAGPDPLLAVVGYGVMSACVALAREIIEAADRVVANHARCNRIVTRVQLMEPLLRKLQTRLDGRNPPEDIDPMLQHLRGVYTDCRTTILKWCDNSGSWKQVVRNMVRSKAFQDEFLDLNDRLSSCYNDLSLALNINQATAPPAARTIDRKEAEADLQEDLRELAEELMTRGWGELEAEEQALVKDLYAQNGLDLDQLLKQAKKAWQEDKIKDLRVPWRHIRIIEEVGSGGYGTVYRAVWAGSEVAVKKFSATAVTDRVRKELEREAYIMSTLHHPNVARFYGVVMEHPQYALLMQYYPDGTLLQLLQKDAPLPWVRRYRLAHDIAQGMCYLHSRPVEAIVHGDLKSSNLLLTAEGRVVITDFGLAKVKTTTKTIAPGAGGVSACYCAPELLNAVSVRRTPACDVYSYGMILFEIATREMPFEGLDIHLIYNHVRQGVRPDIPDEVPQAFSELIRWCWAQKPADRPTFDQIAERLSTFLT